MLPQHLAPALGALVLSSLLACSASSPPSGSLVVRCGRLFDGVSDEVKTGVTVWIEGRRIRAVGTSVEVPRGTPELDLSGHTCLPGLIDLHTHLTSVPEDTADLRVFLTRTFEASVAVGRRSAQATLAAGFTTVRDVGTYLAFDEMTLRDEIEAGKTPGPRIQGAGAYLTIPGGGGDLLIPGVPEAEIPAVVRRGVARGAAAFAARAEDIAAGGADLLKVIASGAVLAYGGVPGAPEMTPEELAAVVVVARRHGLKVAAHAHGAQSVREAILAEADTIEHASLIDEEGLALARERGTVLVMDVYNGDYIDTEGRRQGWPQEFLDKNLATTEEQRRRFTRAVALGVAIGFGTDAAVFPHGDNARQFRIMVERGMTPMAAIRSATSVAAKAMGWEDRVGALVPGRFGDLIAVSGDPLAEVSLLEQVAAVVKGGEVVKERP
ncbi:MAG TPA: amidohydrolase family protein [Thermoanaerobaculia bacterium]|nr:amidohydrolase family protein [Thermoanaerobaculia bacterium]